MMASSKRSSFRSDVEDEMGGNGNPSKRPKSNLTLSAKEVNLAGYVEKVLMKNFMCHSAMEVNLNNRINFILGRNGSGKSAILAAIVIALGCKASTTNRASSLKDFIKTGTNAASVQVTLSNEGIHAYKPEVYGSKIIVIRTLYNGSNPSSYKLKSEKGEIISTKREELDKIITAFNIQVDNPISVLNQDTARTFLASSDPKTKYSIFMKATKLEDVNQLHAKTLNCEANVVNRLKSRREMIVKQENEIKDLKKKASALKKLEEIRNKELNLVNEYFWAQVRDKEKEQEDMKSKIEKQKGNTESVSNTLSKYKEELERKSCALRETKTQIEEISQQMKEKNELLVKLNAEYKEVVASYRNSLQKYNQFTKEEQKYKSDMQAVEQEIQKYKGGEENVQERKRLTEAIENCKLEKRKISAVQETTELDYQNLRGECDHFIEDEKNLQKEKRQIESDIVQKKRQIETLKSQSDNLTMYGDWMPKVLKRIDELHGQGKFVRKPLGPLGAFIKVRDAKWARAIEIELGLALRSFGVHCTSDFQVLVKIFNEIIGNKGKPGILSSKFTDKLHDISGTSINIAGYKNIFNALEISDINVANFLIDNCGIEGVLLIESGRDAAVMMSGNVSRNCKKCITMNSDQYFPYPDFRMYAGNPNKRVCLLQVSKEDIIKQLKVELSEYENRLIPIEDKLNEVKVRMLGNRNRLNEVEKRIMNLRVSKSKLNSEISHHEIAIDLLPDPQHFLVLHSELENLKQKIDDVMEKWTEANKESDSLKQVRSEAAEKVKMVQQELQEIDESRQKLQAELANRKDIMRKAESKVKECEVIHTEHSTKVNAMVQLLQKLEKETEEAVTHASKLSPVRIKSNRPAHVIKSDIIEVETYKNTVQESTGVTVDIIQVLNEKVKIYQENVAQLNNIEAGLKILAQSLNIRKKHYKIIRRIMALKVAYVFNPLLRTRGYKGCMEINHEAKTLKLQIAPKREIGERGAKSLSGGERSYSTVSFILALWECVEPPFYFMDEFDVFMDKVNRRVVIDMLLMQARQKKKHQYVFFTPQDTSIVEACEDITILKLEDPERTIK